MAPEPRRARGWLPAWLRTYDARTGVQDGVAGIVVTMLLVPQSLAYAMLAGLPPHVGMYATILPLLAYAAFGSSMTLSVGPVAVASLMTAAAIGPLAAAGSAEYVLLAGLLAMMGGLMLVALGFLRMGFLANLLSHPVISGFITGSAVLIALGQLRPLLGVPAQGETAIALARSLALHAMQLHPPTAALGAAAVLVLWAARRHLAPQLGRMGLPAGAARLLARLAPMAVVLGAVGLVIAFDLDRQAGIAVVGSIPRGLPAPGLPLPTLEQATLLFWPALLIALIGFVESVSVAQSLAVRRGEHVDPDAELRGLGAANLASAVAGGFPVTGGFARSVVNFDAGARTPMSGVVSAALMLLVLLGFTGVFERLPLAVLAATIIVAVTGLVDVATVREAWRYDRADALAWSGTALGVLALGVEAGVATGVAMSIGTFLWRASRPHIAVLGRLPGTEHFRNVQRFAVETFPGVLLLRIDENLFFANTAAVVERIRAELRSRPATRYLVLVLSSVSHVDLTAAEALDRLRRELAEGGVRLYLAEVKGPVLDRFRRADNLQGLLDGHFTSVQEAVRSLAAA